ncbi:hypothetical protein J2Z17_003329 [Rhizobium halophytocola]|uniref:Uncharacterized protein n=1 Tax=Rhizobium halophytocola TaxID=735519 RepID=A0ABS4E1Q4_9HYPH|nr:hypothetical protein [Rhizobium halophytocola]
MNVPMIDIADGLPLAGSAGRVSHLSGSFKTTAKTTTKTV